MYKLIKIDNYPIIINDKEPEDRKICVSYHKIYKSPILDFYYQGDPYVYPVSSIIASNHPKTNNWFPSITFSDEVELEMEEDLENEWVGTWTSLRKGKVSPVITNNSVKVIKIIK